MNRVKHIDIDLDTFKIVLQFQNTKGPLILHFDTPSRKFYLSLIALIVHEMKQQDHPGFVYIRKVEKLLKFMDDSLAGSYASGTVEGMWEKIRKAWHYSLPNLEEAAHFKIEGRDLIPPHNKGGKFVYDCTETECDVWSTLFGVDDITNKWRFRFAVDVTGLGLSEVTLKFGDLLDDSAWGAFLKGLKDTLSEGSFIASIEATRATSTTSKNYWKWYVKPINCFVCGSRNLPKSKYCSTCGQNLNYPTNDLNIDFDQNRPISPILTISKIPIDQPAIEGERKMVTALLIEAINSDRFNEANNPEKLHRLMSFIFNLIDDQIQAHNGMINHIGDDGLLALFGAPVAQEDHARHACYAALSIKKILEEKAVEIEKIIGLQLNIRMGLNSGLVVAGTLGGKQRRIYTAIGNTIRIANDLKNMAVPGTILVSVETQRHIKDYFKLKHFSDEVMEGKGTKDKAFQLIKAGKYDTRIEIAGIRGFTKFVGRKNTVSKLLDAFENVKNGSSQVLLLSGEAGSGKSRVLHEFTKRLPQEDFLYLEGKCMYHGVTMPYLPILDILNSYFNIQSNDTEEVIKKKIESKSKDLVTFEAESTNLFKDLLSEKTSDTLYQQMEPDQRRRMTFSIIKNLFFNICREKPLVLAVEDFHWIDKTSEDFFLHFINCLENNRILIVMVYRSEYNFQQIGNVSCQSVNLRPLTPQSSLELIQAIFQSHKIDKKMEDFIYEHSAGNPLIIEEIVNNLTEQKAIEIKEGSHYLSKRIESIELPDSIRGIIAARIDRLEDNLKAILQTASIIGRVFLFDILRTIFGTDENLMYHLLSLQRADLIYEMTTITSSEYIFKHALIQDVAYDSLLQARRRELHKAVAKAIEELFPKELDERSSTLGYHYERAGVADKTVQYLSKAAERARVIYANDEAIQLYNRVTEQLSKLIQNKKKDSLKWQETLSQVQEELGDVLELIGRHEEARLTYLRAIDNNKKRDGIRQARIHRKIGKTWEIQGDYKNSDRCYYIAERFLNEFSEDRKQEWYSEWIEIQLARLLLYYFISKTREMEKLIAKLRFDLEKYGSPTQTTSFYNMLTLKDYRRYRYLLSHKTLVNPISALEASLKSKDKKLICFTRFMLGFSNLWCDKFDEAQCVLQEASQESKKIGDVVNLSRCLTYLVIAYRRENKLGQVQKLLPQCLEVAKKAQMQEYVGTANANSAWLKCRKKEFDKAIKLGQEALDEWDKLPKTHASCAFKWTAIFPLMCISAHKGDYLAVTNYAKMLLDPKQKKLPDLLTNTLKKAITDWETNHLDKAVASFKEALQIAKEKAYV